MLARWRSGLGEWDLTSHEQPCRVDVTEMDREVLVRADVPGFRPQEIEVGCDAGMLTIVAHREARKPPGRRHIAERRNWHLVRNLALPCRVGEGCMTTVLKRGVLEIRLPK